MREVNDQYLEDEGSEESEIGEDPDMGIAGDDELLTVKKSKYHGNSHRGGIV
jgi:hypothetical protein